MVNPRLRHLPFINRQSKKKFPADTSFGSAVDFAATQTNFNKNLRNTYGTDWIVDVPLINPMKIIEEVAISPLSAAMHCQHACTLLGKGHHRRVADYIAAAYYVACGLRDNDRQINLLAKDMIDGRTKKPLSFDNVKDELLHYLFIFIFFQSKLTTRDRATHYAQALQPYFDSATPPAEVAQRLYEHGPDRLRRAAQLRAKRLQDARAWAESGHPALIPMDEAVAAVAARMRRRILLPLRMNRPTTGHGGCPRRPRPATRATPTMTSIMIFCWQRMMMTPNHVKTATMRTLKLTTVKRRLMTKTTTRA